MNRISFTLLTGALLAVALGRTAAQSDEELMAVARSVIQADRQATVAKTMQLTDAEAEKFWPLYQQYRADLTQVGDGLQKVVLDYARLYPNVPEDRAKKMLKELMGLEKELVSKRAWYLRKFGRILPPGKALRFAQVENRLDLALRLELASEIPIVPIEGHIAGEGAKAVAVVEGVPGGAVVQTFQVTATVAAIDQASRKVTLVSPEGIKQTVKAGPEVINFDQIRIGDQVKVTATEELVVQMAEPGEAGDDGAAALVALAPPGAKPGGLFAQTTHVTGKVTAMDRGKRTATLQFADGTSKTFPVRGDVDLSQHKVGDQVLFRVTEMMAISVEKP